MAFVKPPARKKLPSTPISLDRIQRRMAEIVMNPLSDRYKTSKKLRSGESTDKAAREISKPNKKLTSLDRLSIYNRQYWFRLIDSMYEDFPGVLAIVGQNQFQKLVRVYLEKFPSRSFSLRNLGKYFPVFIKQMSAIKGPRKLAAFEMAQFEWAQVEAFDGLANPPVTPEYLVKHVKTLKITLQPYVQLLSLEYPFDDIFLALKKRQSSAGTEASVTAPTEEKKSALKLPKKQKIFLVVHRYNNILYYKRLDKPSFKLLLALREGKSLAEAFTIALPFLPKKTVSSGAAISLIQSWFSNWTTLGWLCNAKQTTSKKKA